MTASIHRLLLFLPVMFLITININAQNKLHTTGHHNTASFLFKKWYITAAEKKTGERERDFIDMPSEQPATVFIQPDGSVILDFLKERKGSWAYSAQTRILVLKFPNETLTWKITGINDDSITYNDLSKKKPTKGRLLKI